MELAYLIAFLGYISIIVSVGVIAYRRQKGSSDFSLGNRAFQYWVTAIATQASDMSAWLFMGFPGTVYSKGVFALWIAIGLVFFMFLNWHFIAPKLRTATEKYGAETLATFFEKRLGDKTGMVRTTTALIALFFFAIYISAGIVGLGRALEATFGLSYLTGAIIGSITITVYILLGGFTAVSWNNFLQGMLILFVIALFPIYALHHIGGFANMVQAMSAKQLTLSLFPDFSQTTFLGIFAMTAGWGLGYFGQPHILVNFMGIKNAAEISKAKWLGIAWQCITLCAAALIGLIGVAFFQNGGLANNELVLINMVKILLPTFIAGVALCAIFAASLSNMSCQILVSASLLAQDIYKNLLNRKATAKNLLSASRLGAVAIITAAFMLSLSPTATIFDLILYAWCGLGSAFGPAVILSLYSKSINTSGTLAGIITGALTSGLWHYTGLPFAEYPIIPGFALGFVMILVVSHLTNKQRA